MLDVKNACSAPMHDSALVACIVCMPSSSPAPGSETTKTAVLFSPDALSRWSSRPATGQQWEHIDNCSTLPRLFAELTDLK